MILKKKSITDFHLQERKTRNKSTIKKAASMLFVSGIIALTILGCSGSNSPNETPTTGTSSQAGFSSQTDASTEAPVTIEADRSKRNWNKGVVALTDYVSDEEMERATMWMETTDDARIAATMRKAAAGKKITVACIGGSITQGAITDGTSDSEVGFKKCYADIFHQWWTDTFPDTEIEFINAGIGATDSYLGVHRVQKDVLDYEPDLVLVEFSVNDAPSNFYKNSYDNLIRRIYLSDSEPAVMILMMGLTNGSTAQDIDSLIGYTYKTPMLSYINVIQDLMDAGTYTDKQLAGDGTHPTALGHAIVGEILWKYLNNVNAYKDTYDEPEKFEYKGLTKDKYLTASILDNKTIAPDNLGDFVESNKFDESFNFPNGWTCESGDGNLTFTITCKNLGILYYRTTDGKSGQFEVLVDGESIATLDANFQGGWGDYTHADEIYTSDEAAEHTIVI